MLVLTHRSNISVYHNISDAPYSKPDDPPISDPMGLMALVVTTGMGSTDSYMDESWHTFKDGKVFE